MKKKDIFNLRYIIYLYNITEKRINLVMAVSLILLLMLMFLDYNLRNSYHAVYTRIPSLIIALIILSANKYRQKNKKIFIARLYNLFLLTILVMMYAKFLVHLNSDTMFLNTLSIITAIFIVSLEIRTNLIISIIIYFAPLIVFLIILFLFFSFNKIEFTPLIDVFLITVVGIVINRVQNKLRFKNFQNKSFLKTEKQKLYEINKELDIKNKDLEKFNDLFIEREFRIKELKDRIKVLEDKK